MQKYKNKKNKTLFVWPPLKCLNSSGYEELEPKILLNHASHNPFGQAFSCALYFFYWVRMVDMVWLNV